MLEKILNSEFMRKYGKIAIVALIVIAIIFLLGNLTTNICQNQIIIREPAQSRQDNVNARQAKILDENNYRTNGQYGSFPYFKIELGDNPEKFVEQMNGVGFDEGYGLQCVAGFKQFTYSMSGKIITAPFGAAKNYANASAEIEKLGFSVIDDVEKLQNGDWVIFSNGEFGHVAMYYDGKLFGQNQRGIDKYAGSAFSLDDIFDALRADFVKAYRPNIYIKINNDELLDKYGTTGKG